MRAQTFYSILNRARDDDFSGCMDRVRGLPDDQDFEAFIKSESPDTVETRRQVRLVVDFLNDAAHLIRHQYVTPEHILGIYLPSILACHDRLLKWWLPGFRHKYQSDLYYRNFEFLCNNARELSSGGRVTWPSVSG